MIIGDDRWVIEAQEFCGPSITHRCNWLLIDDPSITHRLLYCAWKTLFLLSCTIFFRLSVIVLSVLDAFFLVSEDPVDDVETQSANHKYRWFSIVQYFTLPNSLINNKTTVTNQSENETNKYADKNPLRGYRFFSFCGCLSAK